MAKEWYVGDTSYQFPDAFSDDQVRDILVKQGVIKGSSPKPDGPIKTDAPPGRSGFLGAVNTASEGAARLVTGAARGVESTLFHAADPLHRGARSIARSVGIDPDKVSPTIQHLTGLDRPLETPEVQQGITPRGALEKTGFYAEQAGEFLLPVAPEMKVAEKLAEGSKLAKTALAATREGVRGTVVGTAQTGSLKEGLKSGIAGAAAPPLAAGVKAAAGPVESAATSIYRRTLLGGGGQKATKIMTDKVVPEALARKVWGATWKSMSDKISQNVERAGREVDDKLDQLIKESENTYYVSGTGKAKPSSPKEDGEFLNNSIHDVLREERESRAAIGPQKAISGKTQKYIEGASFEQGPGAPTPRKGKSTVFETEKGRLSTQPIIDSIMDYAHQFLAHGGIDQATGQARAVVVNRPAYDQAMKMAYLINEFGDDISLGSLVKVRRILDSAVSEAKGHILDQASGSVRAAQKAGADAIRSHLSSEFPDLRKVNQEYTFWKRMDDVMSETAQRKSHSTHGIGPIEQGAAAVGAAVGALDPNRGGSLEVVLGAAGMATLTKLVRSTGFKTLTAIQLDKLSNVLAEGNPEPAIRYINYLASTITETRTPSPPKRSDSLGADRVSTAPPPRR